MLIFDEKLNEIKPYNVTGAARKALVSAISNITGDKAIYKLVPTCAYEKGGRG